MEQYAVCTLEGTLFEFVGQSDGGVWVDVETGDRYSDARHAPLEHDRRVSPLFCATREEAVQRVYGEQRSNIYRKLAEMREYATSGAPDAMYATAAIPFYRAKVSKYNLI